MQIELTSVNSDTDSDQDHESDLLRPRTKICYRPQRSCSKVTFSQVCVKNSVHRGGGFRLRAC